jgi:hypothetical protein
MSRWVAATWCKRPENISLEKEISYFEYSSSRAPEGWIS